MRAVQKPAPETSLSYPVSNTKYLAYGFSEITLCSVVSFFRLTFLSFILVFALLTARSFGGCGDSCTPGNGDCSLPCQICFDDGEFGTCRRCCELQSEAYCNSYPECTWTYNSITGLDECRDDPGAACNGVPEVPEQGRKIWFLWGALLALLPFLFKRLGSLRRRI